MFRWIKELFVSYKPMTYKTVATDYCVTTYTWGGRECGKCTHIIFFNQYENGRKFAEIKTKNKEAADDNPSLQIAIVNWEIHGELTYNAKLVN